MAQMTRISFRLWPETLERLKSIEKNRPRESKRLPTERIRLVIEDYVDRAGRKRKAGER